MNDIITPARVERRLLDLSREYDEAHQSLHDAEMGYMKAKTAYEVAYAKTRMQARREASQAGIKLSIPEIDDIATIDCEGEYDAINIAEAIVKSERANSIRLRTQIDIARSVGTIVRAALEG